MKKLTVIILASIALSIGIITYLNARSGCCSHHGGVCGCSGGRAICCDGQPSPSCGCN